MRKLILGLSALLLIAGGWYFASPWFALMGLQDAVRAGDREEITQRVDFPALRASAGEQLTEIARQRIEQGTLLEDLRDIAVDVLDRESDQAALTPRDLVEVLLSDSLGSDLVPEALQGPPLEFDIEREGLNHFRAVGTLADGTPAPDLIFARHGFGWKLTGFELP